MFRYLVSILTIGLISTTVNAAPLDKKGLDYEFNVDSYPVWDLTLTGELPADSRCLTSTKDPACLYYKWLLSVNSEISDTETKNYINERTKLTYIIDDNNQKKLKHNPILASNFSRPDGKTDCEKYTKPTFDKGTVITKSVGSFSSGYKFKIGENIVADEGSTNFLNAFNDVFSIDKDIIVNAVNNPYTKTVYNSPAIEKVPCSNFFKPTGGNLDELHRGLIEQLMSTKTASLANDIKTCFIYLAVDEDGKRYAYNDARLSWNLIKVSETGNNVGYHEILDDPNKPNQVKKLSDDFVEKRFPKTKTAEKNLKNICSDEQVLALLERKIIKIEDIIAKENKELLKYMSGQILVGKYANDILKEAENNTPAGGPGANGQDATTPTSCSEPSSDNFLNSTGDKSLFKVCEEVCTTNITPPDANELKRCNKRCLKERKGYTYYDDNNQSHKVDFQKDIVFSSFTKTVDGKVVSYEQALIDYDACLVAIGKKMSKEQKWATGMQAGGMTANLLMGLFGMYQTTSANEDAFAMQMEMLKASDKCYSLKPDKEILKQDKRSFFGWIFSGFKSTNKSSYTTPENYTQEQKDNNEKLKVKYNVRNPLTGLQQDMTPYEICVINLALAAMNQFSQNQMLCNQLYGSGLMSQTEYKYCLQGKTPAYARMGGNFAAVPGKSTPKDPEKQEDKKAEEPKKAPDGGGNPSAGAAAPSGSSGGDNSKTAPDYLRNSPYYRYNPSKQSNLDYQSRGYGYENTANQQGSVDVGTASGNKSVGAAPQGSYLELTLPSVHNTTRENVGK